jgi:hypothetical protein
MGLKRTASAFSVNWIIPRKNFEITKGEPRELRIPIDCTDAPQARHALIPILATLASFTTTTSAATVESR